MPPMAEDLRPPKLAVVGVVAGRDASERTYVCDARYIQAVVSAGGMALVLPYLQHPLHLAEIGRIVDGLLFIGGGDHDPALYGAAAATGIELLDRERDHFELALAREALAVGIPVLGICRGMQTLCIAAGGSLYPDLGVYRTGSADHRSDIPIERPAHRVALTPGTRLASMSEVGSVEVNSAHHQAVRDAGRNMRVAAVASDGVIEAIESEDGGFAIGVQWHPEYLPRTDPLSKRLFGDLVAHAAQRARGREDTGEP